MQTPPPGSRLHVARCLCPHLCPGLPSSGGASRPGSESTPADVIELGYFCDSVSPPKVALWGPGGRDSGSSFSGDSVAPPGAFTLPMCCLCRIKTVSSPGGHPRPLCSLLCAPCFVQDLALSRCRGRRENQAGSPLPSVEEAAAQRVYEACLVQVATTEAFLLLPSAPPSPWLPSLVSEGPSVLRPSPGGHKEVTVRR